MAPCTADLFSSAVPSRRLLLANFGRDSPIIVMAKWPFASSINTPRGFGPNASYLLPSGRKLTFDTIVQVPTSCSLSELPCAKLSLALSAAAESARAAVAPLMNVRHIIPSHAGLERRAVVSGRLG